MTKDEALDKMADNARELGLDYEPEIPQAFNDWWNADTQEHIGNPFKQNSYAYWAWAGWKAAVRAEAKNAT